MKTVLLTTSILKGDHPEELHRLYESVCRNSSAKMPVTHVMLLQNPNGVPLPELEDKDHYKILRLESDRVISLSEARNRMLAYVAAQGTINDSDLVAFPDDDCWYPGFSLNYIFSTFVKKPKLDFLFSKYRSHDHEIPTVTLEQHRVACKQVVRNASSNTIFLRGSLLNSNTGFDRNLGVGTKNNGGEDLDYALRSYLKARESCFLDGYTIGHRDKDKSLVGQYYLGSAIVLKRYMLESRGLFFEAMRKFLIGLVLIANQKMMPKELFLSLKKVELDAQL